MEARPKPRRTPTLAVLGFHAALLMAPIAALGSVATYTPRTEAESLLAVAAFAVASLVLLALSWRCLPRLIRVSAFGLMLMSGFALWMLGCRGFW